MVKMILPNKEEMLKRLITVDDNSHLQQKFYPLLLRYADSKKVAEGIVQMLNSSIIEYCKDMPDAVYAVMLLKTDDYIDALCDDREIAEKAKAFLKEVIGA